MYHKSIKLGQKGVKLHEKWYKLIIIVWLGCIFQKLSKKNGSNGNSDCLIVVNQATVIIKMKSELDLAQYFLFDVILCVLCEKLISDYF